MRSAEIAAEEEAGLPLTLLLLLLRGLFLAASGDFFLLSFLRSSSDFSRIRD
jgi:hypothetical protein